MKKTSTQRIYVLATAIMCCNIYCKKDLLMQSANDRKIEFAKNWYLQQQKNKEVTITASNGSAMPLRYSPDWKAAKMELVNSDTVLNVPVSTNLVKAMPDKTSFALIIRVAGNKTEARTVTFSTASDQKPEALSMADLYKTAFSNADLSSKLKAAELQVFDLSLRRKETIRYTNSGKVSIKPIEKTASVPQTLSLKDRAMNIAPPTEGCVSTDWYLVYTEYDDEGNVVYQDIEFLYTTEYCPRSRGGISSSSSVAEEFDMNTLIVNGTSEDLGAVAQQTASETRTVIYTWKIAKNTLQNFISHEEGKHKKVNGEWEWLSLKHKAVTKTGMAPLVSTSFNVVSEAATIGKYMAGIQLGYEYSASAIWKGNTISYSRTDSQNSPVWNSKTSNGTYYE